MSKLSTILQSEERRPQDPVEAAELYLALPGALLSSGNADRLFQLQPHHHVGRRRTHGRAQLPNKDCLDKQANSDF